MALAWILLNILDLILTSKALGMGAVEANPVLGFLLRYNFWVFALGKMSIAVGVAGIYQAFKTQRKIFRVFAAGNILIGLVIVYEVIALF